MLLIGARILKYRKAANMNQEEFAAKIGVSRQAVSKWELDKAYPDLDKLLDICEIFDITIDELVHGKTTPAMDFDFASNAGTAPNSDTEQEMKADSVLEVNMSSAGRMRGKSVRIRLGVLALLLGMLFLFCGTVFATVLFRHAWDRKHVENAKVERVYQQYTKADISFFDDESRKVLKTVWLDIDGIRDGDFIECYTDEQQSRIYYDYYLPTLMVPGICTLLFLLLFVFICMELRRLGKEDKWHVLIEEDGKKESGQDE